MSKRRPSIEVALWATGLSLLAIFGAARAWSGYASHRGVLAMREARAAPDMKTWSQARRDAYQSSLMDSRVPNAVLRIPSLDLEVPIYAGTSDAVLNRGAGLIDGTALPGGDGNVGIAAHRDGFFRSLEQIQAGDDLYIDTVDGSRRYRVSDVRVVLPQDVGVLGHTAEPTVTLVTCYPFHFIGAAPQRFIVRAELIFPTGDTPSRRSRRI